MAVTEICAEIKAQNLIVFNIIYYYLLFNINLYV